MVGRKKGMLETAERDLWFAFSEAGTYYVDIAQCLSILNRKFYRQGMQYAVENLEMNSDGVAVTSVSRLPDTWVVANAWEKCMRAWLAQQNEAAEEAGLESTIARYRDFKIYMDTTHTAGGGMENNAVPLGTPDLTALPAAARYNWEESQIVIPNDGAPGNTTERTFHMIGANVGSSSAGMIEAYAESRARPQSEDPSIVDVAFGGILGQMRDVGDDDQDTITNFQDHNSNPPYVIGIPDSTEQFYPGGGNWAVVPSPHLETIMTVRNTAPSGGTFATTFAPGFVAGCGLLKLSVTFPEGGTPFVYFKVGVAAGNYKGVAARSMAVVN